MLSVCLRTNTSGEPSKQRLPYLSLSCSCYTQGQTFKASHSSPGSKVLFHYTLPEEDLCASSEFTREQQRACKQTCRGKTCLYNQKGRDKGQS